MTRCPDCHLLHVPDDTARCANALRLMIVLGVSGAIWKRPERLHEDEGDSLEKVLQEAGERRSR